MKKLIFVILFLLMSTLVHADTLVWIANTDDAIGYKVYSGVEPGNYDIVVDAGNVTAYVLNDAMNQRYFAITAYDQARNESGYTEALQYIVDNIPPSIPGKPILKYSIEFE